MIRAISLPRVLLAVLSTATFAHAGSVYWTEPLFQSSAGIFRSDTQNPGIQPVIPSGLNAPYRLALDPVDSKIYWTSLVQGGGIWRANLDGSQIQQVRSGGGQHLGITIDAANRRMIWNELNGVRSANLDGSDVRTLLVNGIFQDVALDAQSGKVYAADWSGGAAPGRIRRVNLDGSNPEVFMPGIVRGPTGLAVDPGGGSVYWSRFNSGAGLGSIDRSDLSGMNQTTFVPSIDADSLALDLASSTLYFTSQNNEQTIGDIRRIRFDGSGLEVFLPLAAAPGGVAFVPEPASIVLIIAGMAVASRRRIIN